MKKNFSFTLLAMILGCLTPSCTSSARGLPNPEISVVKHLSNPGKFVYDMRVENKSDQVICLLPWKIDQKGLNFIVFDHLRRSKDNGHVRFDNLQYLEQKIVESHDYINKSGELYLKPGGFVISRQGYRWNFGEPILIRRKMEFESDPVPFTGEKFNFEDSVYSKIEVGIDGCGPRPKPYPSPVVSVRGPDFLIEFAKE